MGNDEVKKTSDEEVEFDENDELFKSEPEPESEPESEDSRFGISEALKKLLAAGVGAAFMTEENVRSYFGNVKLPKDVVHALLQNANKSKAEILDRVTDEVVKLIKKINFVDEASRFVEEHKFKISAEVEVIRKEKPDH